MIDILNKKSFYSMILKDRFPLAKIKFPMECGEGRIELFRTPLGVALRAVINAENRIHEIKMYDKNRSKFVIQNVFCGDNLIEISDGVFVGVSNKLSIEEAIGRDFLIKLDNVNIVARAENLLLRRGMVDKNADLGYN